MGAPGGDGLAHGLAFVTAEIVHDHDVAGLKRRGEAALDIDPEDQAVHGSVDDEGRDNPIMAETRDES